MAKAGKKYKAWREKHDYPIGPKSVGAESVGKNSVKLKGPSVSFPHRHSFEKPTKKGK